MLAVKKREAVAKDPALAVVVLGRGVLQVTEALARLVPPEGAEGRDEAARGTCKEAG
jgi:hypothetical protein